MAPLTRVPAKWRNGRSATRRAGWWGALPRAIGHIPPLPTIVFLAVTIVFMPKALFGAGLFAPLDILSLASPWQDATATAPHAVEAVQNDFVQSVPVLEAMARILRHGAWPMWSPYIAGGEPLGTLVTSGFQDPFNLLLVILPSVWGLAAVTALRLLFSQTFFYLFLRRLGISSPIATFGAVAYTFCGTQIALLGRINAYLILPMMLWATVRILQRRGAGDVALLAIASGLAWLADFPAGFANAVAIDVLLALFLAVPAGVRAGRHRGWWRPAVGGVALVACGLALSAGLVAVSLLPNERILNSSGLVQQRLYSSADHLDSTDLIGTFSVRALGSLHNAALLIDTAPGHPGDGGNSVEVEAGAGMIVSILALAGALLALAGRVRLTRTQRAAYLWSLVAVVGGVILVYFKTPLLSLFYDLPLIGSNPANRLRIIIDVGFSIVACLGLEGFRADRAARASSPARAGAESPSATTTLRVASGLAVGALAYTISLVAGSYLQFIEQTAQGHVRHALELEILAGVVVTLLAFGVMRCVVERPGRELALSGVGLLLALATFATTGYAIRYFTPTVSRRWYLPRTSGHAELAKLAGRRFRILGSGLGTFYADTSIYYRYLDLRGLSISTPSSRALIFSALPNAYALDHFKIIYTPPTDPIDWSSPVLDDLAVRYYVGATSDPPFAAQGPSRPSTGSLRVAAGPGASAVIAPRPGLTGIQIPVQLASGSCAHSEMRIGLTTPGGQTLSAALRPAVDAPVAGVVPADFLIPQASIAGHRRLRVSFSIVPATAAAVPPCTVAVGTRDGRPNFAQLLHRPGQPRVVSNNQAIFYERPHSHPIVWTTGRWQPTTTAIQALALATLPSRNWRSPVPVAGAGAPSNASGGVVGHARYVSDGFDVTTRTAGRQLLATGFTEDNGNWTVTVDKRRARLASVDGGLLGTVVPAGTHTVRFRYSPPDFSEGELLSIVAFIVVIGLILADYGALPHPGVWRRVTSLRSQRSR